MWTSASSIMGERSSTAASRSPPVPRTPGAARLPAGGRPAARQGVRHASPGRGSQESIALHEPGRRPRPGGRQPAGSMLPAPFQRVQSPGPADRVPPRLCRLTSDIGPAPEAFPAVLEMEAPEDLRCLARNGLREMAACGLKARGAEEERGSSSRLGTAALSREVAAERSGRSPSRSGCGGSMGQDISDLHESRVLRALSGRAFSALELLCIMYAIFKICIGISQFNNIQF